MMRFWQGKRVLLTGHTGFKGSWLSLWLQSLGADLVGYALPASTSPNLFTLASVAKNMTSILGDVRDYSVLQGVIQEHRPEIIIHMAAQPLVRYSYREPIETYATNVMGTVHLLEGLRLANCAKAVVNVTTDKCYENKELGLAFNEEDRLGGGDPYSSSKACSELVTSAYRDSYFANNDRQQLGLASARAGNVIGGGDWAQDRLVPDIINACLRQETVAIRNPQALRPWQHVLEPLSGYLLLAQKLYEAPHEFGGAWNFGPAIKDIKPVGWLADYIVQQWASKAGWKHEVVPGPHEVKHLTLSAEKAKAKLGWQPRWDLEKGLAATIAWYQAFQENKDLHAFSLGQIQAFMSIPATETV